MLECVLEQALAAVCSYRIRFHGIFIRRHCRLGLIEIHFFNHYNHKHNNATVVIVARLTSTRSYNVYTTLPHHGI